MRIPLRSLARRFHHGALATAFRLALVHALLHALPARASDYVNVCRSADGSYEIDDGKLHRVDPKGEQTPAIAYSKQRETTLSRETGHCLSDKARGQQFKYETRSSTLRAAFTDDGRKLEVDFICEFVSDGLPAAYSCDKRVVGSNERKAKPEAAITGAEGRSWLHNGSIMRLEASANERRFVYEAPRAGIRKVGAKPGTLLFKGLVEGAGYSGTAYVFAAGCPPQPYAVEGRLSDGGRRLVLSGKAPRISASCDVTGARDDSLVFTWKP